MPCESETGNFFEANRDFLGRATGILAAEPRNTVGVSKELRGTTL
jgi:hypothetical protein